MPHDNVTPVAPAFNRFTQSQYDAANRPKLSGRNGSGDFKKMNP
jgi:hypothetical protein